MLVKVLQFLEGHTWHELQWSTLFSLLSVAISTDGGKIVSGGYDKTVRIWSTETGQVAARSHACSLGWLCV